MTTDDYEALGDARPEPDIHADEVTQLRGFLDYHRATFLWKIEGLTAEQLAVSLPPSEMTLGGMAKHLASNETSWFDYKFAGRDEMPPFDTADWESDPDWDWRLTPDDTPESLRALFDEGVRRGNEVIDEALTKNGMDQDSVQKSRRADGHANLRWVMLHMIEEYARHNGHADFIRQSIDGRTGE